MLVAHAVVTKHSVSLCVLHEQALQDLYSLLHYLELEAQRLPARIGLR